MNNSITINDLDNKLKELNLCFDNSLYENNKILEKMCVSENVLQKMKKYLNESDAIDIKKKIENNIDIKKKEEYKLILILKLFKHIVKIDNEKNKYREKCKINTSNNQMYIENDNMANMVRVINTEKNMDNININDFFRKTMTDTKIRYELLTYELMYYNVSKKNVIDGNIESFNQLKMELDRFIPLFSDYFEDYVWTLNTVDTMNFKVPENKIIYSNTIDSDYVDNNNLLSNLKLLISHIRRLFTIQTIKYNIVEDTKYNFSWVLISIGYKKLN